MSVALHRRQLIMRLLLVVLLLLLLVVAGLPPREDAHARAGPATLIRHILHHDPATAISHLRQRPTRPVPHCSHTMAHITHDPTYSKLHLISTVQGPQIN